MADDNSLAVQIGMRGVKPPPKERNFDEDFAESVGVLGARQRGMSPNDSMIEGIRFKESIKDPLFELRKLNLQTQISGHAAQLADSARSLTIKNKQTQDEQDDANAMTSIIERFGGKHQEMLQALNSVFWKSGRGVQNAVQARLQLSDLVDADETSKAYSSLTSDERDQLRGLPPNTPQWRDALKEMRVSKAQSTAGKEIADRMDLEKQFGADSPQVKRFDEITTKSSSPSNLGKLLEERRNARPEEKGYYDQAIGHLGQKMGISIQYDDQGRPIINYGPQKTSIGDPSVATQSMSQRKLLKYEAASELINYLQKNMSSGDVGLSGVLGEYVGDRILPQLGIDTFKGQRADVRSTMIAARESLLREISDDTRFSNLDREEISKALPSSGVFESLPNAQQRLSTVRNILNARGRTYSEGLGLNQPEWSLSPDEIKGLYEKNQATGGKEGISFEKAKSLLERFHHFTP